MFTKKNAIENMEKIQKRIAILPSRAEIDELKADGTPIKFLKDDPKDDGGFTQDDDGSVDFTSVGDCVENLIFYLQKFGGDEHEINSENLSEALFDCFDVKDRTRHDNLIRGWITPIYELLLKLEDNLLNEIDAEQNKY